MHATTRNWGEGWKRLSHRRNQLYRHWNFGLLTSRNIEERTCVVWSHVKVDVLCQHDEDMERSNIWSDIILGMSVKLRFLVRLTFEFDNQAKQVTLPNAGGPPAIRLRQKGQLSLYRKEERIPSLPSWSWYICLSLTSNSNWNISSSWVSSLLVFGLELTSSALLFLSALDLDKNNIIGSPGSTAYQL